MVKVGACAFFMKVNTLWTMSKWFDTVVKGMPYFTTLMILFQLPRSTQQELDDRVNDTNVLLNKADSTEIPIFIFIRPWVEKDHDLNSTMFRDHYEYILAGLKNHSSVKRFGISTCYETTLSASDNYNYLKYFETLTNNYGYSFGLRKVENLGLTDSQWKEFYFILHDWYPSEKSDPDPPEISITEPIGVQETTILKRIPKGPEIIRQVKNWGYTCLGASCGIEDDTILDEWHNNPHFDPKPSKWEPVDLVAKYAEEAKTYCDYVFYQTYGFNWHPEHEKGTTLREKIFEAAKKYGLELKTFKYFSGDLDGSGQVDIFDASIFGTCFGYKDTETKWKYYAGYNPIGDFIADGILDIYDAAKFSEHYTDATVWHWMHKNSELLWDADGTKLKYWTNGFGQYEGICPECGSTSFSVDENGNVVCANCGYLTGSIALVTHLKPKGVNLYAKENIAGRLTCQLAQGQVVNFKAPLETTSVPYPEIPLHPLESHRIWVKANIKSLSLLSGTKDKCKPWGPYVETGIWLWMKFIEPTTLSGWCCTCETATSHIVDTLEAIIILGRKAKNETLSLGWYSSLMRHYNDTVVVQNRWYASKSATEKSLELNPYEFYTYFDKFGIPSEKLYITSIWACTEAYRASCDVAYDYLYYFCTA